MKTRRISRIVACWLALVLVLLLMPSARIAGADEILDRGLIGAAERSDLAQVNSVLDKGADASARIETDPTVLGGAEAFRQAIFVQYWGLQANVQAEKGAVAYPVTPEWIGEVCAKAALGDVPLRVEQPLLFDDVLQADRRFLSAKTDELAGKKICQNPWDKTSQTRKPVASDIQYREVKRVQIDKASDTHQACYAISYEPDAGQDLALSDWPSKLCFFCDDRTGEQYCFEATARESRYACQVVSELSVISLSDKKYPQRGVLFRATFFGGGSGTLSLITLWVYNEEMKKFVNILPEITITNIGEYQILKGRRGEIDGTLVTANAIWFYGGEEMHFGPHKYKIDVYRYKQKTKRFELAGSYVTKVKYPSGSAIESDGGVDVIGPEIENIKKYVSHNVCHRRLP